MVTRRTRIFRLIYKCAQPVRLVVVLVDHLGLEKDQAEHLELEDQAELLELEAQEAVAELVLAHQVERYIGVRPSRLCTVKSL
jgi:hypothetical protein